MSRTFSADAAQTKATTGINDQSSASTAPPPNQSELRGLTTSSFDGMNEEVLAGAPIAHSTKINSATLDGNESTASASRSDAVTVHNNGITVPDTHNHNKKENSYSVFNVAESIVS